MIRHDGRGPAVIPDGSVNYRKDGRGSWVLERAVPGDEPRRVVLTAQEPSAIVQLASVHVSQRIGMFVLVPLPFSPPVLLWVSFGHVHTQQYVMHHIAWDIDYGLGPYEPLLHHQLPWFGRLGAQYHRMLPAPVRAVSWRPIHAERAQLKRLGLATVPRQGFCTHLGETPIQRAIWALIARISTSLAVSSSRIPH